MSLPTREELLERFTYCADDGTLISDGKEAGYVMGSGYRLCSVKKQRIYAHRIIWCMMTGSWPSMEIDHANGKKSDNRWSNLRLATRQQNAMNRAADSTNKSGFKGVSFHKGKWRAVIKAGGKHKHLGYFNDPSTASIAYLNASKSEHGEFSRA